MLHILRFFCSSSATPAFCCYISASVVSIAQCTQTYNYSVISRSHQFNASKAPLILLPAAIRLCVFSSFFSNARTGTLGKETLNKKYSVTLQAKYTITATVARHCVFHINSILRFKWKVSFSKLPYNRVLKITLILLTVLFQL